MKYVGALLVTAAIALAVTMTLDTQERESALGNGRLGTYGFDVFAWDDELHLLLVEYLENASTPTLFYRRSKDGGESWSAPARVDEGLPPPHIPSRGVDPQLAASGDAVVAVWTTAGEDVYGYGTGPLATASSTDGGATWRAGANPADDGLQIAHEYIDVAADGTGAFHLIWIDDREHEQGVRRGLRYAQSSDTGKSWTSNTTLDPQICGCCWTHLRLDDAGTIFAMFRDEEPAPSDMKLMASPDGGQTWSDRGYVGAFGWRQRGCPHTTAGFVVGPERFHALVQTGHEESAGLYHLASSDNGDTWTEPARLAAEGAHYADLAAAGDRLAAVWQDQRGRRTVIVGAVSEDEGRHWSVPAPISSTEISSSYPRIVANGTGFRVFWTESEDGSRYTWTGVAFP